MHKDWIAILDFGSQYTHLIARRLREFGVYSEIVPFNIDAHQLLSRDPSAVILSGGPASVTEEKSPVCDKDIFNIGIPILGICYGAQLMTKLLGGRVDKTRTREYGKAVRIIGPIEEERLDILREADWILIDEIKREGLYRKIWQSFYVLLPVRTVGVMGDERTYENVVALRVVTSEDAMTAQWAKLPFELLERISNRIINEVNGINRVVYDISSKPPSTIEWE